jgi:hypothetical protein
MVMRPRHALAAAAILTAVTIGSWAALSTDGPTPAPQAADPQAAPVTTPTDDPTPTSPRTPDVTRPDGPQDPAPGACPGGPAGPPRNPGMLSRTTGDFDGDRARDQLLAYAELDAAGQPHRWHVRVVLAAGPVADLALDDGRDWIGPDGLVARRAVDANGDGRDEGFVTSTGGASNDAYNLFGLAGCQLRQVRIAGAGLLQLRDGASAGHATGFDCQAGDGRGRRLLAVWGVERAEDHADGRSTYTWTRTGYRWITGSLVRPAGSTSGSFVAGPEDPWPPELRTRCGSGAW